MSAPFYFNFEPSDMPVKRFVFADGLELTLDDVLALADAGVIGEQYETDYDNFLLGSTANDTIHGNAESNRIDARDNEDALFGAEGNDAIAAGDGADVVDGGSGDDVMAGGFGSDSLDGGDGDDTYVFNRGDGQDVIIGQSGSDTLSFGVDVLPGDVSAYVDANGNLVLQVDGGAGGSISAAWFDPAAGFTANSQLPLANVQFVDADGHVRVFDLQSLVSAMDAPLKAGDASNPAALFLDTAAAAFEVTGSVVPAGGDFAVAYAQTGDLFGEAYYASGNAATNGDDVIVAGNDGVVIDAGDGNDVVAGGAGNDAVLGGAGNDILAGGAGNDVLNGGTGADVLRGGTGDDALLGGGGSDVAVGGEGSDNYLFNLGDGELTIVDQAGDLGENLLTFGPGITADNLRLSHTEDALLIYVSDNGDVVRLTGFNPDDPLDTMAVGVIRFDDGSMLGATDLLAWGYELDGTPGADNLVGGQFDDTITGNEGDDLIVGGQGNDYLAGGDGDDTYVFNLGDGVDTIDDIVSAMVGNVIRFGAGITSDDLDVVLDGDVLTVTVGNNGDAMHIQGVESVDGQVALPVSLFQFADGSSQALADWVSVPSNLIEGTDDDDLLIGTDADELFIPHAGEDFMAGGMGDDVYEVDGASQQATIDDVATESAPNTLRIGMTADELDGWYLTHDVEAGTLNLVAPVAGAIIVLTGFDRNNPYGSHAVEYIQLGVDGPTLSYAELIDYGFTIMGSGDDDTLLGTAAHDTVIGDAGNDRIVSGPGNDTAEGGEGDDTYVFNRGDGVLTIVDSADETGGNTLEFGAGITAVELTRALRFTAPDANTGLPGELIIRLGDTGDEVHLSEFDPDDVEYGTHAIEQIRFADGTVMSYRDLVRQTFVVQGDEFDNALQGTNLGDRLYGFESSDTLSAGLGDDVLTGGTGDDVLVGGAGRDAYVFNLGDGVDEIDDAAENGIGNILNFGDGVTRDNLSLAQDGTTLIVRYGDLGDEIRVLNFDVDGINGGNVIDTIELADGSVISLAEVGNLAPEVGAMPADIAATEDRMLTVALPDGLFVDPENGVLMLTAMLADGNPLPSWLSFDAVAGIFSGVPENVDVGTMGVKVIATDPYGATAEVGFALTISNVNDAPSLLLAPQDAIATQDIAFAYQLPESMFADVDAGDSFMVSAMLADGSPLPTWLVFDAATMRFVGTPANGDVGLLGIHVSATDRSGATTTASFSLAVVNVNDAPIALGDIFSVDEDTALTLAPSQLLANDSDIDPANDVLEVAAVGNAVNGAVQLDTDGTIRFTPVADYHGAASFDYVVADGNGGYAATTVDLQVNSVNDAPVANAVFTDQLAIEDAPFSLMLPTDLFTDIDVGDSLTYTAMRADGTALPSWLAFDQATGTFSGTPGNGDVGNLSVALTATDSAGATATQSFAISVLNVNDSPVTAADTAEVAEDGTLEAVGNVLANDTDIDVGDRLSIVGGGTYQGSYGQLTLDADGQYRYLLDNAAAQALGEGARAVEHFAYAVTDGTANVDSTLDVTIAGRNDAPVLVAPLDPVAITVGSALSWTLPPGAFTDADAGDTLNYGLVQEDGAALPAWLTFDAATRTLAGTPTTADTGALRLALVAMDGSGAWAGGLLEIDIAAPQGHGEVIVGTPAADTLVGTAYDDVLDGQGSVDTLAGGDGNDLYLIDANRYDRHDDDDEHCGSDGWHDDDRDQSAVADLVVEAADGGYDTVWSSADYTLTANVESLLLLGGQNLAGTGNGSNNLLVGNRGNNDLDGLSGDDLQLGGLGNDHLSGGDGLDALDGGYGNDMLEDGVGNGFVAGGRGNDTIRLQGGADVIAFNRGDGKDAVEGGDGRNDILSLGGGIKLGDLKLGKEGRDLVVDTGRGDSVRLTNWYAGGNRQTVSTLQIAHADDASRFDRYNFAALVADFDNSRKSANTTKQWSVAIAVPRYSLADTQPTGGELAVRYAQNGDLEQVHPDTVATALSSPAAAPAEVDSADAGGGSPSGGDAASQPVGDNHLPDDSPDYWSQLDTPVAEDTWDTAPMMADVAADWLHYAEQNGYDTVSSGDARIDYAVTWARLRDELSGLLDEDRGGGDGHWMFSHDSRDMWLNASGANGGYGTRVNFPGNLLKQFEGLKEGMDKLHG